MEINREELEACFAFYRDTDYVSAVNNVRLAQLIMKVMPTVYVADTGELLVYHGGRYVPNGAEMIKKLLVVALANYTRLGGTAVYSKHLCNEVLDILKGMRVVESWMFDPDVTIINMENGRYDWSTGELLPHDPEYLSRIQIPVRYDPNADCPSIKQLFNMLMLPGDVIKMREFIAYCLYRGYPIQKAFILYGKGGTGKSHFLDIIVNFLGRENCSSVSMHALEEDRFATSDLHCKLLNAFGDMSQATLPNVNILKMLTSGKDEIRAQRKGQQAFKFVNFAKLIFGTNKLPKVLDDTSGFYRRIELIPFDRPLEVGFDYAGLLAKCLTPEEMSGLFNWVIPMLAPLLSRKQFINAFTVEGATEGYKAISDPVAYFLERYVLFDQAGITTTKEEMYNMYLLFCQKHNIDPPSRVWFGRDFARLVPGRKEGERMVEGKRKMVWVNIGFNPETINELLF